jgi:hypothetical protein
MEQAMEVIIIVDFIPDTDMDMDIIMETGVVIMVADIMAMQEVIGLDMADTTEGTDNN